LTRSSLGDSGLLTTDGPAIAEFIEATVTISKGSRAGQAIVMRSWQRELLADLFEVRPDGLRRYRQGLIGLPRKNGKSAIGSGLALFGLFDEPGAEVYSCAGDKDQARIVFQEARRSVEASPLLSERLKCYRDAIENKATLGVYRVLSSEAPRQEGLNPSLVIFDELHVQPNDELWNVMNLGSGTRDQPLILAITTAGVKTDSTGQDSTCYRLWQYGRQVQAGEVADPSFFFRWWGAPDDADHHDPRVWTDANPALGDYLHVEDLEGSLLRVPENEFRTKRLNQWVSSEHAWLPAGTWAGCEDADRVIVPGEEVVIGFDGSFNNDSTGLVVATVGETPHLDVVAVWEKPVGSNADWVVPIDDVEQAIRDACKRWRVREVLCDPYRWARSMQILEAERIPMVEFPQNPVRMTPATQRFYEAVMNGGLTHSGHPVLARHIDAAVLKSSPRGQQLAKEKKKSPRKIDLAVCAVMAFEGAATPSKPPISFVGGWA
jgi:phage terminase large subunit-like protein